MVDNGVYGFLFFFYLLAKGSLLHGFCLVGCCDGAMALWWRIALWITIPHLVKSIRIELFIFFLCFRFRYGSSSVIGLLGSFDYQ
jgi:hypothetical protein